MGRFSEEGLQRLREKMKQQWADPETRKRWSEASRKKMQDPENRAKVFAGRDESNRTRRHTDEERKRRGESIRKAHARRKSLGKEWVFKEEDKIKRRERFERNRLNPDIEAKRKIRAAKALADPKVKVKRMIRLKEMNDKKRGFAIPAKLHKEYYALVKSGKKAQEAGRILGLIK